jgi:hypothetical protein
VTLPKQKGVYGRNIQRVKIEIEDKIIEQVSNIINKGINIKLQGTTKRME